MKDSLAPGLSGTAKVRIDAQRTIGFMGEGARVYATPAMVADIERSCRDLMLEHLDEGEDSVGMRVELDHLGPTLLDMEVEIETKVAAVEGRRIRFEVTVRDPLETVGRGVHDRFVVDVEKVKQRLAAKRAKAGKD